MKPFVSRPYILDPVYDTSDLSIIRVNAAAFRPAADGSTDASGAIQQALDTCAELGGGTVYLPEGRYALRNSICIPSAVTLRGEWVPGAEPNRGRGTILCAYYGKNDPEGQAQIRMAACSGLKNCYIYYPEQQIDAPIPYSPTVRQISGDNITVENVTMVNPWLGVKCGPGGNELHTLKNFYATPLYQGCWLDRTTDIGRLLGYYISPSYWENFTLKAEDEPMSADTARTLRAHMLANTYGVFMARSDWEYVYDVHIEHCHIGIEITELTTGSPNLQMSQVYLHNCDVGVHYTNMNSVGCAFSDSVITADLPGLTAAIWCDNTFKRKSFAAQNGVDIRGCYPVLIKQDSATCFMSFVNCRFEGWTDTAITQTAGTLSVQQCDFAAGAHARITADANHTQILGCTFEGEARIDSAVEIERDDTPLNLPVIPRGGHKPFPYAVRPKTNYLYLATNYGVTTDPRVDNTAALQAALDAAGQTGGVVYLPGGWYRFDRTLTVPSGVELRGVFEVPSHTMGGGTVLRTYHGRHHEDATPFLTLGANSGIRGFVIQHPQQDPAEPVPYPWAVQSTGENVYAVDVVLQDAWLGMDFATYPSKNHYLSYIGGAPFRCGIFVGHCDGDGWVENMQFNPHYLNRSNFEHLTGYELKPHWHRQLEFLDALRVGDCANEHMLGNFVFGCKRGLQFVKQEGRGATARVIGHGSDGDEIGLALENCEKVDLINAELVAMESPRTRMYVVSEENAVGEMVLYNSLFWGPVNRPVVLHGGTMELQQTNYVNLGDACFTVDGGNHRITASFFQSTCKGELNGGRVDFVGNVGSDSFVWEGDTSVLHESHTVSVDNSARSGF